MFGEGKIQEILMRLWPTALKCDIRIPSSYNCLFSMVLPFLFMYAHDKNRVVQTILVKISLFSESRPEHSSVQAGPAPCQICECILCADCHITNIYIYVIYVYP